MSGYVRKTHDEWIIEGNWGYGWDIECNAEDRADAKRLLREYEANCAGASFRIRKLRVPNEERSA